jgi:hypothetical protein
MLDYMILFIFVKFLLKKTSKCKKNK